MHSLQLRIAHAVVTALMLASTACVRAPAPVLGAPSAQAAVVDRLYFGRNIPGGGFVSDSAWRVFLGEVVTPRLPSGFTTWRTEGQWRGADGAIVGEAGVVLEVIHSSGAPADDVIEAIAAEYRRRFRQEAVLRVRAPGEMWMYRGREGEPR